MEEWGFADTDIRFQRQGYIAEYVVDDFGRTFERDADEFYRRKFFNYQMGKIFGENDVEIATSDKDFVFDLCDNLRDYMNGCFSVFCEIARSEKEDDYIGPTVKEAGVNRRDLMELMRNWYLKRYAKGKNVSKYFKDAKCIPVYFDKLIRYDNSKYTVENPDVDSVEFKLALFSLLDFASDGNNIIWGKKCKKWLKEFNRNFR